MKKKLAILVCILLLTGCTFRFIYNHLDWIIPWYVSDFLDLEGDQETFLEQQLKLRLQWHRLTQLNAYAKTLKDVRDYANRGLTRDDLDRTHNALRKHWQNLIREVAPDLAQIIASATDAQLEEFHENLDKRGEKFKEKYIDPSAEERRKKKVDRMEHFLEFWFDSLTEEQKQIVDRWSRELQDIAPARLSYMKDIREEFNRMLVHRHDVERFTTELQDLLYFKRDRWPSDFKAMAKHNRNLTKNTFVELDRSLTATQRTRLIEKLTELSTMLEEMSRENM